MNSSRETFSRRLRRIVAVIFLFAGTFKLLWWPLQVIAPQLQTPSFAQLLQVLGVPFPAFFAVVVPLLEVLGGGCLWHNFQTRAMAIVLACDMSVAIFTVGLPAISGHAPQINGSVFGGEVWRLPLEIGLLIACLSLALEKGGN